MKKKTAKKRPATRAAKKPAPKRPTTAALAQATAAIQAANTAALVPAISPEPGESLTLRDDAYLANFALELPTLTAKQEEILSLPIPEGEVLILPTGQPYLPHMAYALWLDKAFGRTGWAMRPMSNPRRIEEGTERPRVYLQQPFGLFIGGKMAAWGYGVAEYHESNRDQNYGDVLEALQSFGLRRCCKHLRIGHELWNKAWLEQWRERHAIKVKVKSRSGSVYAQWRRRTDPKLPFEVGVWEDRESGDQGGGYQGGGSHQGDAEEPRRFAPSTSTAPISEAQVRRLIMIAKGRNVTDERLKAWLVANLPYTRREDGVISKTRIQKKDYERVCAAVEAGLPAASTPAAPPEPPKTVTADEIDWDPRFSDADNREPRW